MKEEFASILDEVGKVLNLKLAPDKNNACQIKYATGLSMIIQVDAASERMLFVSDLGTPPPGRYREDLFREALKANGLPPPRQGIFSYSKKKDSLCLFDSLPLGDLTGQKVVDFITPFIAKAELWRKAIPNGEIPSFTGNELSFGQKPPSSGMFGLR